MAGSEFTIDQFHFNDILLYSKRRATVGSIQKCWAFWTGLDESTASPGRATSVLSTTWEGINRLLSADQLVNLSGLVTNSNLFCRLFKIKDWCKKVRFSTNAQSRFASVVVGSVLGPPRLARHT